MGFHFLAPTPFPPLSIGGGSINRYDASGEYYPAYWFHVVPSQGINTTFNFSALPMDRRYETAFLGNTTIQWIREAVLESPAQPFFAYIAPHAPHGLSIPAPWYNTSFGVVAAPRPPSYGHWGRDHHWLVAQQTEPVTPLEEAQADKSYRSRWQCILSVDDLVVAVRSALDELKVTDNTYFFYTSDHGFHFHELRLGVGKWNVYDVDIRTHMFVTGPGIAPGSTLHSVAQHVDLAPTWLGLAGIATPERASLASTRVRVQPDPNRIWPDRLIVFRVYSRCAGTVGCCCCCFAGETCSHSVS